VPLRHTIPAFREHQPKLDSVALSAGSRFLFTESVDNTTHIWDLKIGDCLQAYQLVFTRDRRGLESGALSAEDEWLVTTVPSWAPETLSSLRVFAEHTNDVTSVALIANTQCLVTSGDDQTVRFWDLGSGDLLATIHQAAEGFLRTTRLDDYAPGGRFSTDRTEDLLHSVEANQEDGADPKLDLPDGTRYAPHLEKHNSQWLVMTPIRSLKQYLQLAKEVLGLQLSADHGIEEWVWDRLVS
jgi:WD40 repeat protein